MATHDAPFLHHFRDCTAAQCFIIRQASTIDRGRRNLAIPGDNRAECLHWALDVYVLSIIAIVRWLNFESEKIV